METLRIDKYLWYTRLVKSRSLAGRLVQTGKIRINKLHITKPAQTVKVGDVITAILGRSVRVIEIVELGTRRGPASEAQGLYKELTISAATHKKPLKRMGGAALRTPGSGRPTKRERRETDRLRWRD